MTGGRGLDWQGGPGTSLGRADGAAASVSQAEQTRCRFVSRAERAR